MAESTSPQKLLLCVAGIYFFYLYYGVYQEQVWTKQQDGTRFGATTFLLLCQCAVNAIFAFAGLQVVGLLGSTSSKSAQVGSTCMHACAFPDRFTVFWQLCPSVRHLTHVLRRALHLTPLYHHAHTLSTLAPYPLVGTLRALLNPLRRNESILMSPSAALLT